ncbi:MAG: Gfo/Idh/MocA family protein [Propionibacteriaceae bacterium]
MAALRVGIVGAGGITRHHAPSWKALGATVSVHELEGAAGLADEFDLTVAATMAELLGTVDMVDICTPATTHCDVALQAVAAGVPIVCEKPIGATFDEAMILAAAARAAGVLVLPAHVVRFFGQYAAMQAAVAAGRIGRPAILRFIRGGSGPTRTGSSTRRCPVA